jgi:hypothetical protein
MEFSHLIILVGAVLVVLGIVAFAFSDGGDSYLRENGRAGRRRGENEERSATAKLAWA